MAMDRRPCDVCGKKKSVLTIGSIFADVDFYICDECLLAEREPYHIMVNRLLGVKKMEDIARWARPYVMATLEFYDKTFEEFVEDLNERHGNL